MGRPRKKYKTFHISVAEIDTDIMEWLSVQFNQSASVRQLIRMQIDTYGIDDLFSGGAYRRQNGQSGRATGSTMEAENALKAMRAAATARKKVDEAIRKNTKNIDDTSIITNIIDDKFISSGINNNIEAINIDEDDILNTPDNSKNINSNNKTTNKKDNNTNNGIVIDKNILSDVIGLKSKIKPTENKKQSSDTNKQEIVNKRDKMRAMMDI